MYLTCKGKEDTVVAVNSIRNMIIGNKIGSLKRTRVRLY